MREGSRVAKRRWLVPYDGRLVFSRHRPLLTVGNLGRGLRLFHMFTWKNGEWRGGERQPPFSQRANSGLTQTCHQSACFLDARIPSSTRRAEQLGHSDKSCLLTEHFCRKKGVGQTIERETGRWKRAYFGNGSYGRRNVPVWDWSDQCACMWQVGHATAARYLAIVFINTEQ